MGKRLSLVALVAGCVLVGCGNDTDPGPSSFDTKQAEIINARKYKERLARRVAAQEKKANAEAEAHTEEHARPKSGGGGDANQAVSSMLASLPGQAGLAVAPPGASEPTISGGSLTSVDAWSTIKVPIVERILADNGGPGGISSSQRSNIDAALTLSDNDAAAALFSDLEASHGGLQGASDAVGEMLRQAGDNETVISTEGRDSFSTYGQTDWSLNAQNRYMAALANGCISDPATRDYIFNDMSKVTSDTWGLGSAGVPAKWKGGWGPGVDGKYLVRQMGTMTVSGKELVVTLAAIPDDGTFESGQAMASSIAQYVASNLSDYVSGPISC